MKSKKQGVLREGEAAKSRNTKKAEATRLATDWKHLLRTNPKTGLTGTSFANILVQKGFDTEFLMTTNPAGEQIFLVPQEIEARYFPLLKLLIHGKYFVLIARHSQPWANI